MLFYATKCVIICCNTSGTLVRAGFVRQKALETENRNSGAENWCQNAVPEVKSLSSHPLLFSKATWPLARLQELLEDSYQFTSKTFCTKTIHDVSKIDFPPIK